MEYGFKREPSTPIEFLGVLSLDEILKRSASIQHNYYRTKFVRS